MPTPHARLALALIPGLALAVSGTLSAGTSAEEAGASPSRGTIEMPVRVRSAPILRATFEPVGGPAGPQESPEAGSCPSQISTHTDASFSGGAYVAQGGFAENEIAATSFTLPASAFPIIIESAEMIFATSGTTVTTTTEWSFLVWQGTPATGTLIEEYNSDGLILPHLVMPLGTNGTNVMVAVDPGDPEQIVVQAGATNTFAVGYRVDKHHDPSAFPCIFGAPAASNAFPTTDTSGLASPNGNWLFGLNCGSFGCPANGGWATFQQLPGSPGSGCTPSGDWVMRVTWRSANCSQAVGACCLTDGSCNFLSESACGAAGGAYQGDNVLCISVNCEAVQLGACCFAEGCISNTIEFDCQSAGGIFQGTGTSCGGDICDPAGACCFAVTGGCLTLNAANCLAAGGAWNGGATCDTFVCFPSGSCCLPDGTCLGGSEGLTPDECALMGGTFQGDGTSCATISCPVANGACCFSATGACLTLSPANCAIAGGFFAGGGSTCPDGCAPQCPADLNGDNEVNFTDLQDLLSAWGPCAGCPQDLNEDDAVDLSDLLELLAAWGPC